ncbi:hypothetical protein RCL1_001171 [Eukaryota sp. TZLM3-RCL]
MHNESISWNVKDTTQVLTKNISFLSKTKTRSVDNESIHSLQAILDKTSELDSSLRTNLISTYGEDVTKSLAPPSFLPHLEEESLILSEHDLIDVSNLLNQALSTIDLRTAKPPSPQIFKTKSKKARRKSTLETSFRFTTPPKPVISNIKMDPWKLEEERIVLERMSRTNYYLKNPKKGDSNTTTCENTKRLIAIDCSTPPIIVEPNPIIFENFEVGSIFEANFLIRNVSSHPIYFRVLPPSHELFATSMVKWEYKRTVDGALAPGLTASGSCLYNPKHLGCQETSFLIECQNDTSSTAQNDCFRLSVPVIARKPVPVLTLPEEIDFGDFFIYNDDSEVAPISRNYSIKNLGGFARFRLFSLEEYSSSLENSANLIDEPISLCNGQLIISPRDFLVENLAEVEFCFTFRPTEIGTFTDSFVVVCDHLTSRTVSVTFTAHNPTIKIQSINGVELSDSNHDSPISIDFSAVTPCVLSSFPITLINPTPLPIPFSLSFSPLSTNSPLLNDSPYFDIHGLSQLFSVDVSTAILSPQSTVTVNVSFMSDIAFNSRFGVSFDCNILVDPSILQLSPTFSFTSFQCLFSALCIPFDTCLISVTPGSMELSRCLKLAERVKKEVRVENNSEQSILIDFQNLGSNYFQMLPAGNVKIPPKSSKILSLLIISPSFGSLDCISENCFFNILSESKIHLGRIEFPCSFNVENPIILIKASNLIDFGIITFNNRYSKNFEICNPSRVSLLVNIGPFERQTNHVITFNESNQQSFSTLLAPQQSMSITLNLATSSINHDISSTYCDFLDELFSVDWQLISVGGSETFKSSSNLRVTADIIEPFIQSIPPIFELKNLFVGVPQEVSIKLINDSPLDCTVKLNHLVGDSSFLIDFDCFDDILIPSFGDFNLTFPLNTNQTRHHESLILLQTFCHSILKFPNAFLIKGDALGLSLKVEKPIPLFKINGENLEQMEESVNLAHKNIDRLSKMIEYRETSIENEPPIPVQKTRSESAKTKKADKSKKTKSVVQDDYLREINQMTIEDNSAITEEKARLFKEIQDEESVINQFELFSQFDCDADVFDPISLNFGTSSCNTVICRRLTITNPTEIFCSILIESSVFKSFLTSDLTFPPLNNECSIVLSNTAQFTLPKSRFSTMKSSTPTCTKSYLKSSTTFKSSIKKKSSPLVASTFDYQIFDFSNEYSVEISNWLDSFFSRQKCAIGAFFLDGRPITFDCPLQINPHQSVSIMVLIAGNFPGTYRDQLSLIQSNSTQSIVDIPIIATFNTSPLTLLKRTPNLTILSSSSSYLSFFPTCVDSAPIQRIVHVRNNSGVLVEVFIERKEGQNDDVFSLSESRFLIEPFDCHLVEISFKSASSPCNSKCSLLLHSSINNDCSINSGDTLIDSNFSIISCEPILLELEANSIVPVLEIEEPDEGFELLLVEKSNRKVNYEPCYKTITVRNPSLSVIYFSVSVDSPFFIENLNQNFAVSPGESAEISVKFLPDVSDLIYDRYESTLSFIFNSNNIQTSILFGFVRLPELSTIETVVDLGSTPIGRKISHEIFVFNKGFSLANWYASINSSLFSISKLSGTIKPRQRFQSAQLNLIEDLIVSFLPNIPGKYSALLTFTTEFGNTLEINLIGECIMAETENNLFL